MNIFFRSNVILRVVFFIFFISTAAACLYAQSKSGQIDMLMNQYLEYELFNGSVLAADEDGVIFKKGYGFADMEWDIENTADTKFRLGSITKQFTAVLILKLVDEGKLKLDGALSEYLPYYRKDTGEKITIHQLLNHTSGIPSYTSQPDFFRDVSRKYYAPKDFVVEYCSGDLEFDPGSAWSYNNSGYFILGAIIEEVTGKSYEDYLHEIIFNPLGMKNSGYDHHSTILPKRAEGYEKSFTGFRNADFLDMSLPYAAGSLYSTVEDLFIWDRNLYENNLISSELKEKMFTPTMNNYGYGFAIYKYGLRNGDSLNIISHGGGINGFNTLIFRAVDKKQLVVLLNNTGGTMLNNMAQEIIHIINGLDYNKPKRPFSDFLSDYIIENGAEDAEKVYDEIKNDGSNLYSFNENQLNNLGYFFLRDGKIDEALAVFGINIKEYPESFNVYDSMGEAYLEKGENEKAIEYYKKSLDINPRSQSGIDALKNLGVEVDKPEDVEVPTEILDEYLGKYEMTPQFVITITRDGQQLKAQATNQPVFDIYPESETKFYFTVVDAVIEFIRNNEGKVVSLLLTQNGQKMPAIKVE
ncbi:MAG: serine hydrolase [Melioribacteraceae bacterium]|nr:serine hydrolase [Melioribacteraceae bacterium]MCF8353860.1 serine hydrolase [Melioribacteraceae bacterium]MCF8393093.1 serine hydrolase [Melioribacteraceae bacterium]MCF8419212.1 serine hydrolase [Melioribacteraceae bacterium]